MKKNLHLVFLMMLLAGVCQAERHVSTEVENKKVLIEEFTGIHCGYCPQAHKIVADLMKAQPDKVYAVAIHAGSFSVPNSDEPDFRIAEGIEINNYFEISGYPAGMINRQRFDDMIVVSRNSWGTIARMETETMAPVNLWMDARYDAATGILTVDVEGYYTADVEADFNLLNVVVTENNIVGPQSGGGMGSEYIHKHMARAFLTSTWGDTITTCKRGDFFSKQYTYNVPADIKEVPVNPAELEIVAFIAESNENILNVTGCHVACDGVELPLAADIAQPMIPINGVYGYDYFDVELNNRSTEEITSATFKVSFNGKNSDVEWTGVVAPRSTATVRIPYDVTTNMKASNNQYTITLKSLNGTEYKGNSITDRFSAPVDVTPAAKIEFYIDEFVDENHFYIKDMDGNVVHEFGPYEPGQYLVIKELAFLQPNTRYCFEITDSWANGIYNGYIKLYDINDNLMLEAEGVMSNGARIFFNTTECNVSKEVQKKNIFIEDFTGIHCGNCPDAHEMINEMQKAQGEKIHAVAIHAGHYAQPFPEEPDFRTAEGDSLNNFFDANSMGYPCGLVNRRYVEGQEQTIVSRAVWVEFARNFSAEDAPVNLWVGSAYDPDTRMLTVNVEGYYTADVDATFNALNVLIAQSGILGPQSGGSAGNFYIHNHVLRDYITPIWGDTITSCKAGDFFHKQYVYEVPADINGVATNAANFEVVAFVTKDKEDVLNVESARPNYPGLVISMNAEISEPLIPISGTYGYNYYEVLLTNNSTEDIVEAGFDVYLNDQLYLTEWVGLAPARSTTLIRVPFTQNHLLKAANDFTIKLGGVNYALYDGNSIEGTFQDPIETTPKNKFIIKTDKFAGDNRYLIKDADGNIVHEFGPYATGAVTEVTEEIELEEGKVYCIEITDAWGDGVYSPRGTVKIYNGNGKLMSQMLDIRNHGARTFFTTTLPASVGTIDADKSYEIAYNKAEAAVEIVANTGDAYNVAVYNAAGQCVYAAAATQTTYVPVAANGIYVVEVTSDTLRQVEKVVVY